MAQGLQGVYYTEHHHINFNNNNNIIIRCYIVKYRTSKFALMRYCMTKYSWLSLKGQPYKMETFVKHKQELVPA